MTNVISIREYDKLYIRPNRDLERGIISNQDALYLQTVVIDNSPVFAFGNRCLIAQKWVGVIELPEFTIEILPKIYGEVSTDELKKVLVRMLLVSHQTNTIRQFRASVSSRKNSLIEMLIESFLVELRTYVSSGLQHEYKKVTCNISKVKGQIIFSQQLRRNILAPTRFYCKYSSYIANNELNQFFKACLSYMAMVTRDQKNKQLIDEIQTSFFDIQDIGKDVALAFNIEFNSINARAKEAYKYGRMFLENINATMNAGSTHMYTMLFDMEQLYELFIYRVASMAFGGKVAYQKRGGYMVSRDSDGKKFISLRPDLTLKINDKEVYIIDTKWKMPNRFAKESDVYQMNAYSTSINNVKKVILLYPRISRIDHLVDYYTLISNNDSSRPLEIQSVDLMKCLSWNEFMSDFKRKFTSDEEATDEMI